MTCNRSDLVLAQIQDFFLLPQTFMDAMANLNEGTGSRRSGSKAGRWRPETGFKRRENSCETLACLHSRSSETSFFFYLVHKLVVSKALKGKIPKQQCWVQESFVKLIMIYFLALSASAGICYIPSQEGNPSKRFPANNCSVQRAAEHSRPLQYHLLEFSTTIQLGQCYHMEESGLESHTEF